MEIRAILLLALSASLAISQTDDEDVKRQHMGGNKMKFIVSSDSISSGSKTCSAFS